MYLLRADLWREFLRISDQLLMPSNINQNRNYFSFLWHAFWLALANTFADRNTVLPGLIIFVGGTQTEVGILTAITVGIPIASQLFFAGYLSQKKLKKSFLLLGIYLRVITLAGIAFTLLNVNSLNPTLIILFVFTWMFIFSISGAFAGVSYTDILGKSVEGESRKKFFIVRQILSSIGIIISALIVRSLLKQYEYPQNYILMFFAAAFLLFIASFGFVSIKERPTKKILTANKISEILKSIPYIMKHDKNLRVFIIIINLISFSLTLLPFYIGLAKEQFGLTKLLVGNYLLIQMIGMLVSNVIWSKIVKKFGFKGVLKSSIIIQASLPILAVIFAFNFSQLIFGIVFLISGFGLSAQKITNGILLEISNETNRSLYTGIFGAFSLTIMIFPLVSGVLIMQLGYIPIFIFASLVAVLSFFYLPQLNCLHSVNSNY